MIDKLLIGKPFALYTVGTEFGFTLGTLGTLGETRYLEAGSGSGFKSKFRTCLKIKIEPERAVDAYNVGLETKNGALRVYL